MFDMGFTELVLIGIVGLIVIGPDRLPGFARTAGKYFGKLRRFMTSVKADVESELRADELREILNKQQDELQSLKKVVDDVGRDVGDSINQVEASVNQVADDFAASDVEESWTDSIAAPPGPEAEAPADEPIVAEKPKTKAAPKKKAAPRKKSATAGTAKKAEKPKTARSKSAKPKSAAAKSTKPNTKKSASK